MITFPLSFLIAFAIAAVVTPLVRNWALRRQCVDNGESRRNVHSQPTPRLGGIAIVLAFYVPLAGLLLVESSLGRRFAADPNLVIGLFAGGAAIAALGIYDDLRGATVAQKLAAQTLVAIVIFHLGYRVEVVNLIPGFAVDLGYYGGLAFTVAWVVGVINAMNLIDGLDGLASGVALLAVLTNLIVAAASPDRLLMVLFMCCLGGAIVGFLLYNFNPASIFMGDTGSMFLGFVLATTSITANAKSYAVVAMVTPILALGLPLMDTLLAVVRRKARGMPAFSADKEHIHHRLLQRGFSHRQTVAILYGVSALLALFALGITFASKIQATLLLFAVGVLVVVAMRALGYNSMLGPQAQIARRRNQRVRAQLFSITSGLEGVASLDEIWRELYPIVLPLKASTLRLEIMGDHPRAMAWRLEGSPLPQSTSEFAVGTGGRDLARLVVGWPTVASPLTHEDEMALEQLSGALALVIERLDAARLHAGSPVSADANVQRGIDTAEA